MYLHAHHYRGNKTALEHAYVRASTYIHLYIHIYIYRHTYIHRYIDKCQSGGNKLTLDWTARLRAKQSVQTTR